MYYAFCPYLKTDAVAITKILIQRSFQFHNSSLSQYFTFLDPLSYGQFYFEGSSEITCWQWQPSVEPFLGLLLGFPSSPWGMASTHPDRPGTSWRKKQKLRFFGQSSSEEFCFSYVGYPGKLFLNMLKCLIIPLVVPSLIASIGSLDFRMSGKVWADQVQLFTNPFSSPICVMHFYV